MNPTTLQVGPQRDIKTIASCEGIARARAIILVDSGDYVADVAVWQQDDITLRAVGGRVRLLAKGAAAEGKGIWVVRANRMRVKGFEVQDFDNVPYQCMDLLSLEKGLKPRLSASLD
jgi:hypothetical protein